MQFVVKFKTSADAMDGLITVYSADQANGTVYLAGARFAPQQELGPRFIGAVALAVDYLFFGWPIRKVYFESPEFSLGGYQSGLGSLLVEEARLREHVYLGGRYWDLVTLALWRNSWIETRDRYLRFA